MKIRLHRSYLSVQDRRALHCHGKWMGTLLFIFIFMSIVLLALVGCGAVGYSAAPSSQRRETITVSAAISLKDAFKEIAAEFEKGNPDTQVVFNFASSGALQMQIEQGAPVDVFASASPEQMNSLEQKGLLAQGTRQDFAGNTAVLVAQKDGLASLASFADLTLPQVRRLAIGNPSSVPAGSYAKQILSNVGLWDSVQPKIVLGENVEQVLTYVETGDVDAGIVYQTDAADSKRVRTIAQAPPGSSKPIVYPIAVMASSKQRDRAAAFVQAVTSPVPGQAILSRYGFLPPPK